METDKKEKPVYDDVIISRVGAKAKEYIWKEKPSELIPFRGKFPLVPPEFMPEWGKWLYRVQFIYDVPPIWQKVMILGSRCWDYERSFKTYLPERGLSESVFLELDDTQKTNYLEDWMNLNGISDESLDLGKIDFINNRWKRTDTNNNHSRINETHTKS